MADIGTQAQSLFFSRLPVEIRIQILELFVYDDAPSQHIVHYEGDAGFVRIPCWPMADEEYKFLTDVERLALKHSAWRSNHLMCCSLLRRKKQNPELRPLSSPLSLLLACRQMHDETADILYSSLSFIGLKPLRRFLRDRDPSYVDRIRVIHVQWDAVVTSSPSYNLDFEDWPTICDKLGALRGLRQATIRMFVCNRTSNRLADMLLSPLQAVKQANVDANVLRDCQDRHQDRHETGRGPSFANIHLGKQELPLRVCRPDVSRRRYLRVAGIPQSP